MIVVPYLCYGLDFLMNWSFASRFARINPVQMTCSIVTSLPSLCYRRSWGQHSASRSQSRTMSRSNSRSQSRSMSRSLSRSQSRNMSRSMSKAGRSSSRALSFFSAGGSTVGEDRASIEPMALWCISRCLIWILSRLQDDDTMTDDGKLPLVWQINLAEQQLCEPECLQLIHEYIGLLKAWGTGRYPFLSAETLLKRHEMLQTIRVGWMSCPNIHCNCSWKM